MLTQMNQTQLNDRGRVSDIFAVNGRCIAQFPGPNKSTFECWAFPNGVILVQYFKEGGCHHYVDGGPTWVALEESAKKMAARP